MTSYISSAIGRFHCLFDEPIISPKPFRDNLELKRSTCKLLFNCVKGSLAFAIATIAAAILNPIFVPPLVCAAVAQFASQFIIAKIDLNNPQTLEEIKESIYGVDQKFHYLHIIVSIAMVILAPVSAVLSAGVGTALGVYNGIRKSITINNA